MDREFILTVYAEGQEPFTKEINDLQYYTLYDIKRAVDLMFDKYADAEIHILGEAREYPVPAPQGQEQEKESADEDQEQEEEEANDD